jgi:hypothetical protein
VRSPYGHARIRSINAEVARAAPGVEAVFTGEDMLRAGVGSVPPGCKARAVIIELIRNALLQTAILVENRSRGGRFWSSLERQLGEQGLSLRFDWDGYSGFYAMETRKMEPSGRA